MGTATLVAAASCAAWLMGAPPALPDVYVATRPPPARCIAAGVMDGRCRGLFGVLPDGRTVITAIPHFGVLVHEACHLQQHLAGRRATLTPAAREAECYAVQARAAECFRGLGAPGLR